MNQFIEPITKIIKTSIKEGKFLKDWKSAIVVPVHKSGVLTDVSNYRPISILPVISKFTKKCVAEQLTTHLNRSPHTLQFGFQANRSSEVANCSFLENIN